VKIGIFNKKDMIQNLTFISFQSLSLNECVYKFSEPIVNFDNIPPASEKKPLFNWLTDSYFEKRKESITLEEFEKLFQGNFYFKLGVKIP
jgi:hypothetical protein